MRSLFYKFWRNVAGVFRWRYLPLHILAIALTYALVVSGFDWTYFVAFRNSALYPYLFPAAIFGGLLPIIVPLAMVAVGKVRYNLRTVNAGWGMGQAAIVGLFISSAYKFFTGRIQPPRMLTAGMPDVSGGFRFGLFQGGIFWGWPSSHTTVAFAAAVALATLYPENKLVKFLALAVALYIGIGVSVSVHWFSDFIAGVIIGSVIGLVVGRAFWKKIFA